MNEPWVGATSMPPGPPTWNDVQMPVSTHTDVVESRGGQRRVRIPTFVIGLVAVALVAALVGRGLMFGAGGASSPTEAVQQLADALAAEDLAAALTTLAPDEVRDAGDVYATASTKLRNLGVTPETKTLGGIDLGIEDLRLEAQVLGPDVARVDILGGRATLAWRTGDMGSRVQDLAGDESGSESADLADATYRDDAGAERHAFLMAVRRDGGWYVSPFYSVAEYLVSYVGAAPGDFGEIEDGPAARTATDAVDRMIDAVARRDLQAGISSLASGEWAVLRAYRAAIEDAIGDAEAEGATFTIDDWTTSSRELDGDTALVTVDSISGTVTSSDVSEDQWDEYYAAIDALVDGGVDEDEAWEQVPEPTGAPHATQWSFADGCLRTVDPADPEANTDSCKPDESGPAFSDSYDLGLAPGMPFASPSSFGDLGVDAEQAAIVVVRDRDGWGISPVATLFRGLRTVLDHMDEHTIAALTNGELDAAPSVTLEAGRATKVELNSAGYAVAGFRATEGVPFVVEGADPTGFGEVEFRTPDGEDDDAWGPEVPSEDGTYRILVRGTGGSATVTVRELRPTGNLAIGPDVPVHLDREHSEVVLTLDVPEGATLQPVLVDESSATLTILDEDGDVDDTMEWDADSANTHHLGGGRYTIIVTLDDTTDEAEPFDTVLRVVDPTTVPRFDDYDDVTTYTWTVERTPSGPERDGVDVDDLAIEIPAGLAAVVEFQSYEDEPVGIMWRCGALEPWQDTGDVAGTDETAGTFRIEAAPAERSCEVVAVAAESDLDVDLTVTAG